MSICISCLSPMSRSFAQTMREWLLDLFPGVDIEILAENDSEKDVLQGWIETLRGARVGLLCVTPDVIQHQWLHFHLGLLLRHTGVEGLVAPVFLDVSPEDVSPTPLHILQATRFNITDFALLTSQIHQRAAPTLDPRQVIARFDGSWPGFQARTRQIPGPFLSPFIVSVALPHRVAWFRYDPSGCDGAWPETITRILDQLAGGPFGFDDVEPNNYDSLDVAGEKWIELPGMVSRVGTAHIALVHPQVVDAHSGSAHFAAYAIRAAVKPNTAGLKVLAWQDRFVVGTEVL
jgi:hypothetical protein